MRTKSLLISLAVMTGCISCKTSGEAMKQKIINMELNRSKLIAAHDTIALDKMYTDGFIGIASDGSSIGKKELMKIFKSADSTKKPKYIISNTDQVVQILNNRTALLKGKITVKDQEQKILRQTLYVDVLIKSKGRWQITHGQETVIQ